jgi:hypothetical protein
VWVQLSVYHVPAVNGVGQSSVITLYGPLPHRMSKEGKKTQGDHLNLHRRKKMALELCISFRIDFLLLESRKKNLHLLVLYYQKLSCWDMFTYCMGILQ